MTGAALLPSFFPRQEAVSRLRLALAASAACHLLLAAALVTEPAGRESGARTTLWLTVQLASPPALEISEPVVREREIAVTASNVLKRSPLVDRAPRARTSSPALQDAPALALPQLPDSTYYTARDLDVYPRPVAPLALEGIADGIAAPGRVAVTLQIDELGIVNNIVFTGPAAPEALKEGLRAALAATRFHPARKDGRAVRSRLTLSVDLAQERREP